MVAEGCPQRVDPGGFIALARLRFYNQASELKVGTIDFFRPHLELRRAAENV
jgi:hypothetical protein